MYNRVILLCLLALAGNCQAQEFYRWTDASGELHISQTPPDKKTKFEVVTLEQLSKGPVVNAAAVKPTNNDPTNATQNAAVQAASAQVEQLTARAESLQAKLNEQRCASARRNERVLENQAPVFEMDANGKQQFISDDARKEQLAQAKLDIEQYCKQN